MAEDHGTVRKDSSLPGIAVGVLNFNRAERAIASIHEILKSDYPNDRFRVVLIDNASFDDSIEAVRTEFGNRVEIVRLPQNIGPVARNRLMLDREEEYLFIFDEDCHPAQTDTLRRTVMFLEDHPEYGALCFRSWNAHLDMFEYGHPEQFYRRRDSDGTYQGMYVIGNGMCFRREAIITSEGYDERLLWGGEEYDLALELLRLDIPIAFREDLSLIHHHAPRAHSSTRAMELDMRNNLWISVRRFPLLLIPVVASVHVSRRLLIASLKRDWPRLRGYLRGIRTAVPRMHEFFVTRRPVPYRQLIAERKWFIQMFYAPRRFARAHSKAVRQLRQP